MDMEEWLRFCPAPATLMSGVAIKPEGVRTVALEELACSRARWCSRRALALSLFSSWEGMLVMEGFLDGCLRLTILRFTSGVSVDAT